MRYDDSHRSEGKVMPGGLSPFLAALLVVFFLGCSSPPDSSSERWRFEDAVSSGDVDKAIESFETLRASFEVTDREAFEAAWLAFFCKEDADIAAKYFGEIEDPAQVFDDLPGDFSVMHLRANIVCNTSGPKECQKTVDQSVESMMGYDEVRHTYLSQYVDELNAVARAISEDPAKGYPSEHGLFNPCGRKN